MRDKNHAIRIPKVRYLVCFEREEPRHQGFLAWIGIPGKIDIPADSSSTPTVSLLYSVGPYILFFSPSENVLILAGIRSDDTTQQSIAVEREIPFQRLTCVEMKLKLATMNKQLSVFNSRTYGIVWEFVGGKTQPPGVPWDFLTMESRTKQRRLSRQLLSTRNSYRAPFPRALLSGPSKPCVYIPDLPVCFRSPAIASGILPGHIVRGLRLPRRMRCGLLRDLT